MPVKARRALLNLRDGTIYCNPGTVLADDDPIALANVNAIVGTSEPVTAGFEMTARSPDRSPMVEAIPTPQPRPTQVQIDRDLTIEIAESDTVAEEEDTDPVHLAFPPDEDDEPEEKDEGVEV